MLIRKGCAFGALWGGERELAPTADRSAQPAGQPPPPLEIYRQTITGEIRMVEDVDSGPMLLDLDAEVAGVDFSPPAVRLKTELGPKTLPASVTMVARAVELHEQRVRVRYLVDPGRLLSIVAADALPGTRSWAYAADLVFADWHDVLDRLSK